MLNNRYTKFVLAKFKFCNCSNTAQLFILAYFTHSINYGFSKAL